MRVLPLLLDFACQDGPFPYAAIVTTSSSGSLITMDSRLFGRTEPGLATHYPGG